ncbi:DSBA-like thioredoxin domain-containing protein [Xylariales sp. PMI_506]|nr:DSBA-like thioredoxin domain-containing protein [Xylariales sp. PMI_506]
MTNFKIEVISDPVCPFCYLGKLRLDKGIELYKKVYPGGKDDTFEISWSAFYLDPEAPAVGIPLQQRMEQRFGADRVTMIRKGLRRRGLQDGVQFCDDSRIGHTRDAHRLIRLAKSKGGEEENLVVMALFRRYFEESGDITSREMLADVAAQAGIDRDEAVEWLESGNGAQEVDQEVQAAYAKGIHGVPNFTIQGKYVVDGAQDPRDFFDVIVAAKEGKSLESLESITCS